MTGLISCLTITGPNRLVELQRSIKSFACQSYADREHVIVHDGDQKTHQQIQSLLDDGSPDRSLLYRAETGQSLGELRNLSVQHANGSIICQWDDDDLYHPERLSVQYNHLRDTESDFCFLTDQLHWFEHLNQLYWDDWNVESYPMNLIQGTIMGSRQKMELYPALPKGEDTPLVLNLVQKGCKITALSNFGYLYVYVYNGKNSWDFKHHFAISSWKRLNFGRLKQESELLAAELPEYYWPVDKLYMPHEQGVLEFPVAAK